MSFLAVLFAAAALDAPPSDQPPLPEAQAATTVQEATVMGKVERPICRTVPVTGSRFDRRICETPSAAKERRQDLQQALQRDKDQRPYEMRPRSLDGM